MEDTSSAQLCWCLYLEAYFTLPILLRLDLVCLCFLLDYKLLRAIIKTITITITPQKSFHTKGNFREVNAISFYYFYDSKRTVIVQKNVMFSFILLIPLINLTGSYFCVDLQYWPSQLEKQHQPKTDTGGFRCNSLF